MQPTRQLKCVHAVSNTVNKSLEVHLFPAELSEQREAADVWTVVNFVKQRKVVCCSYAFDEMLIMVVQSFNLVILHVKVYSPVRMGTDEFGQTARSSQKDEFS